MGDVVGEVECETVGDGEDDFDGLAEGEGENVGVYDGWTGDGT